MLRVCLLNHSLPTLLATLCAPHPVDLPAVRSQLRLGELLRRGLHGLRLALEAEPPVPGLLPPAELARGAGHPRLTPRAAPAAVPVGVAPVPGEDGVLGGKVYARGVRRAVGPPRGDAVDKLRVVPGGLVQVLKRRHPPLAHAPREPPHELALVALDGLGGGAREAVAAAVGLQCTPL